VNLRELIGVLGHELRTPLAAILGYQELLTDGIYGELDPKKREPLERIQSSAHQLLHLIDGLQELAAPSTSDEHDVVSTTNTELLQTVLADIRPLAQNRAVELQIVSHDTVAFNDFPQQRFIRAADLAGGAAIKKSTGNTIRLSCYKLDHNAVLEIAGTALDAATDFPADSPLESDYTRGRVLTASELRLAMAAATLLAVQGSIALQPQGDNVTIFLQIPLRSSPD
jgi:light-regulated signal transduction histidine kinase (bacteriophytochrome)